jgi:hypothetical protein
MRNEAGNGVSPKASAIHKDLVVARRDDGYVVVCVAHVFFVLTCHLVWDLASLPSVALDVVAQTGYGIPRK